MDEYMYGLIYTIIYILILDLFSGTVLKKVKQNKIVVKVFLCSWSLIQFILSVVLDDYVLVKVFSIILVNTLAIYLYYERHIIKSLFVAIIYQAMVLLCDYVSIILLMKLDQNIELENINNTLQGFFASLISLIITLALVCTLKRIISREEETISEEVWIKLCFMPIISIICIIEMYINFIADITSKQKNTVLVLAVVFIIVNLYVYHLVFEVAKGKMIESRNEILRERNNHMYKQYTETVAQYKLVRKKEHEYKNVLMALYAVALREESKDMLSILKGEINMNREKEYDFDTNNLVTNLIFNQMYQVAEEKNILLSYKFNDLSRIPMSERDIAVLYSNIINNAIEACEKIEDKRRIYISSHCEKSNFIIIAENWFDGELKVINGHYISKKEHMSMHGYGIENIKDIVEKYEGSFANEIDGNIFRLIIIVPIDNGLEA